MDSSVVLDYALFQLTPTRTRCDLIVFYGGKPEKLASGLFEPFVSHLEFARDENSKGGYSIKLCPPSRFAPWFTKSTFHRFVRFVSTPAVLERFVSLECEILQIVQSSAQANEGCNESKKEESSPPKQENSKVQFQRLLETRKSMLRKEQAMAYARGIVAGFEPDKLDDLISFAEAFGASRLRQACINFKELCIKKSGDGLWMQELAAMEAYAPADLAFTPASGIVLTNEVSEGGSVGDSPAKTDEASTPKVRMGMPWQQNHQMHPYMYNFQQMHHPYPYPMQPYPPQYGMNMQWPTSRRESSPRKHRSSRKGRNYSSEGSEDDDDESTGSESETEIQKREDDQHTSSEDVVPVKKHHHRRKKSSSKTVVIRNINYITSKRRNDGSSSAEEEDGFVDEVVGSLGKMNVSKSKKGSKTSDETTDGDMQGNDDALRSKSSEKGKTNDNWESFQNLLMRDEEPVVINGVETFESEKAPPKRKVATANDAFLVNNGVEPYGDGRRSEDFMNSENQRSVIKRADHTDEDLVISRGFDGSSNRLVADVLSSSESLSSSRVKPGKGGEDWFVANNQSVVNNEEPMFNGDCIVGGETEKISRDRLVDDSFMLDAARPDNDRYDSPWRTDIAMAADLSSALENGNAKEKKSGPEPVDLCMVLERESGFESVRESWSTDHGMDISFMEGETRKPVKAEIVKEEEMVQPISVKPVSKNPKKVLSRARTSIISSAPKRAPPPKRSVVHKSKFEIEEEARKKAEEVARERQKRIAERTAAAGGGTKKVQVQASSGNSRGGLPTAGRSSSVKIRAA
ncbi:COP1-interacting protein 7 [Linum grandiflorum]